MLTIWATIIKELLELRRDLAGLMVLLVMPMALVLIVSLVQDNVMQATGEAPIKVLFVDKDHGFLGEAIARQLKDKGGLELVSLYKGEPASEENARTAVVKGDFQFSIIIPGGTSNAFRERIRNRAKGAIAIKGKSAGKPSPAEPDQGGITVYFDPAVQSAFRSTVSNALQRVILGIEFQEQAKALADIFPAEMKKALSRPDALPSLPPGMTMPSLPPLPEMSFKMDTAPVLKLTEEVAFNSRLQKRPTAAQQNVPAWALFGMFFIVVPLSGNLIRERQAGTLKRLLTMPISPLTLLTGKLSAYVLVCLAQFVLMIGVGCFVLPLLGTSGLEFNRQLLTIAPIAVVAALAATGYGIMVGTLARSNEQATVFGAVSIVIAAALGGIMLPVYVMPRYMQDISYISPLAWGLNAFQDVFVRGGNLGASYREIALLLLFFSITITVSWLALRRNRTGA
jgi:ABC-2 type transport system permease protein